MEAAKAEEAFLQAREEERMMDRRKHVASADKVATTPMRMATVKMETTTREEQDDDPRYRNATFHEKRRCLLDIGRERENK